MGWLGGVMLVATLTGCGADGASTEQGAEHQLPEPSVQPRSESGFAVSGVVKQSGKPVEGAEVRLLGEHGLSVFSDAKGRFSLSGVPAGAIELVATHGDPAGANIERHLELDVVKDLVLPDVRLPSPVILDPLQVSEGSISLSWSATDAEDFREYKLYRHAGSGLDESTGELIFVSTEVEATSFVDNGAEGSREYFYRVFVMNETGRLGGSNVVSDVSLAESILENGGFEASDGDEFVADWSRVENNEGTIDRDTEQVHGGNSSVRFTMSNSWEYWITGDLLDASLQAGDRVQVTGYFRADRTDTTPQLGIWLTNHDMRFVELPTVANEWQPFSLYIEVPESFEHQLTIWLMGPEQRPSTPSVTTSFWFDDVRVERVPL